MFAVMEEEDECLLCQCQQMKLFSHFVGNQCQDGILVNETAIIMSCLGKDNSTLLAVDVAL